MPETTYRRLIDGQQVYTESNRLIRTISLRIAGTQEAKDEIADLGEDVDDFVVRTQSKTDQTIRNLTKTKDNLEGISVLDDNGNLRSTYDIENLIMCPYMETYMLN